MGVNMIIKSYNKPDEKIINEIRKLEEICKKYDGIKKDIYLDYSINFNDGMKSLFLLYEHSKLISLLSMFVPTQKEAEISAYTLPEYRQKGYFKKLLSKAEGEMQKYNVSDILFVCESQSQSARKVIEKMKAKYDFTEYLLKYNNLNTQSIDSPINSVNLLKADLNDTETLINMSMEIFHDSYEDAESFVKKTFNSDVRQQFIASVNNKAVGMCAVNYEEEGTSIFGLGILPEYQGKGYGKQMLILLLENISDENEKDIFIEVESTNDRAFNLYKNSGFETEVAFQYYRK